MTLDPILVPSIDTPAVDDPQEVFAWTMYDWANSAFVTTTAAVLFAPYLTSVAEQAACGFVTD